MACLNDIAAALAVGGYQLNTRALSSATANAGELTGSGLVIMTNTGGTPGTYTTRTPAQMIADSNLVVGQTWFLILANNQGTGTLTLGAGSGASVGGTATVAANTARLFTGVVNSLTLITFTGLALAWTSAV